MGGQWLGKHGGVELERLAVHIKIGAWEQCPDKRCADLRRMRE